MSKASIGASSNADAARDQNHVVPTENALKSISSSSDGHFLVLEDGKPFFWLGDTAWHLFNRLAREQAEHYLRDRAAKGYNIIQAVAADGPLDQFNAPNLYGDRPFINGDVSRPDESYFRHVDWIIAKARTYGIRFALLPTFAIMHISLNRGNYDPEKAEIYGRWLGARYRNTGVIWVLGGDTMPVFAAPQPERGAPESRQPLFSAPIYLIDDRPIFDAMAKGIEEGFGEDAFITFHPSHFNFSGAAEGRTSRFFHDRAYLDMNMLQTAHFKDPHDHMIGLGAEDSLIATLNYRYVRQEYDSTPTRPVVDGEARFEDLPVDLKPDASRGIWNGYDARCAAYHAVFAGAAGHTYGNHAIWQFRSTDDRPYQLPPDLDWQDALNRPVAAQLRHIKDLMLSRPYFTRIPDQSIIVGEAGEGAIHVGATRDISGRYAMIYIPDGRSVSLDLSKLSGATILATWFDPRRGETTRIERKFPAMGEHSFVPPSAGPDQDWVLVLDDAAQGFPLPGAAN